MTPDEIARLTSRLRGIPSRSAYWELGEIAAEAIDALAAAIAAERAAREKAEAELARQIECGREVMDISNRALEERNAAEERAEKAEAERDEARAVLRSFEVCGPDADGLVWLILHHGTTGQAMVNLGPSDRITAQVALHLEKDRRR